MAASTSTNQHGFSSDFSHGHWNVFLSFRGEDTRKHFTSHLFAALKQAGINTFMNDPGLESGQDISDQLLDVIRGSDISLVIFSKNYASSPWCLDELLEILECKRKMAQKVYPVFYDVTPGVVRHRIGSFSAAFESHEKRYVSNMDKVDKWKDALTEAANLSGFHLHDHKINGNEVELIRMVVKKVLLEVNFVTSLAVAKKPVGIESRVKQITQLLSINSNDIRKIGIYGMGGIGKTTIAKALFNKHFGHFDGSCFLANVREASEGHEGILHLQEQLLSEILKVDKITIHNRDRGISLLKERLRSKKVLIVLDDLNDTMQFDCLAGQWNEFAVGSIFIITTRDAGLLEQIEVDHGYSVEKLDRDESLELFSLHAFNKPIPSEDYMELSEAIACRSGGLPLALEVLGSYLLKKPMAVWRSSLDKLQNIPRNKIQTILLISYQGLDDGDLQDVFLDIACHFIGHDKDMTISILDSCGFDSENEIIILMERCLVSVNDKNELRMHDLLQEMGRDIARNNCPREPWKHSRLWSCEDIYKVLSTNKGKKCIQCIIPSGGALEEVEFQITGQIGQPFKTCTFQKMHNLRLLSINKVRLVGNFEGIFEDLRWLSWQNCPLESLPVDFCPYNLVFLYLQQSDFKILWNGPKSLKQLKILNLSGCIFLTTTPDFTGVPCIEDLNLSGCKSLVEVDPSIGCLVRLVNMNLMGCNKLKCLPSNICNLTALEQLNLDGCLILEWLPDNLGCMKSLRILQAGDTNIMIVPESIECLNKLVMLKLNRCKKLQNLPSTICKLRALEHLILCGYSNVNELPYELGKLESLRMLSAEYTAISRLPKSIGDLSKLSKLLLHSCKELRGLPSSIGNLRVLKCLDLNYCSKLKELPNNIGNMKSLRMLWADGTAITTLPESIGCLSKLVELVLSDCKMLLYLPSSICNLISLERLDLSDCSSLEELPENIGNITSLRELRAWHMKFREIPKSIGYLKNIEILIMEFRTQWFDINPLFMLTATEFIPSSVFALYSLKNLNLSNCYLVDIPDSVTFLKSLQHLNLSGNLFIKLTPSLGQLINLRSLTLTACKYLWTIQELPPKLSHLYASHCTSVESIDVSELDRLRCLHLSYCSSLAKIEGLDKLQSITRIDMAGCENLSITFEESLFQVLCGFGVKIDIYLPMRDIPCWFRHQLLKSRIINIPKPQNVSKHSLGIIAWLNVGQATLDTQSRREYWTKYEASDFIARIAGQICTTSAWKNIPQSWVILIPPGQLCMEYDEIHNSVKYELESFGCHLMYV